MISVCLTNAKVLGGVYNLPTSVPILERAGSKQIATGLTFIDAECTECLIIPRSQRFSTHDRILAPKQPGG